MSSVIIDLKYQEIGIVEESLIVVLIKPTNWNTIYD